MKKRINFALATLVFSCAAVLAKADLASNSITWSLKYDPKTLDPAKVDDQASEVVRYVTGGVLLRVNRRTQQVEPELADAWSVSPDGKLVSIHLRSNLRFSDGSPLSAKDVTDTLKRVLAPATAAPVAAEFVEPSGVSVESSDALTVKIHLPKRVINVGKVFDEIAIEPAGKPSEGHVTAGPFTIAEYKRGEHLLLRRNANYWKRDTNGTPLPYLASMRLEILANRQQDELRFLRNQNQLIEGVPADDFALLSKQNPEAVRDLGPSLNTEQMWFNQSPNSPLPAWEKKWFANRDFRTAVSMAIHRADLARIAYDGHATPAAGFISPANAVWHNRQIKAAHEDVNAASALLASSGFHKAGPNLIDSEGHPVKFSLLTNAGNHSREKMAALIQQDLAALGMQVNVVTLDFPALIDRLMHTQNYEAAMLGLSDVEPDPSSMMNVWLSSSPNHQWNPSQKTPATEWEAEIDKQMKLQAEAADLKTRKSAVDRVQQIVADQQPFIYLVYPNVLCGISPLLTGAQPTVLQPTVLSSVEYLRWNGRK